MDERKRRKQRSLEGRSQDGGGATPAPPPPHRGSDFPIEEAAMTAAVSAVSSVVLRLLDAVARFVNGSDFPSETGRKRGFIVSEALLVSKDPNAH